jgi:predicted DNA repair protein MutK
MAGASLLSLLDDIATLLDDVSVMTKVAAKKTATLVADDLAVNADQVTGISAKRELSVIWAVAKGATLNKVILIPAALLISAFIPWAIVPLLMCGGAFLCYEGAHKVHHKLFHRDADKREKEELKKAFRDPDVDLVAFEKKKIKGAIRTDFILSAEIIVIALGSVAAATLGVQLGVLIAISALVVLVVYGLVAGIVKIDDLGVQLSARGGRIGRFGEWLIDASPLVMKGLGILGTLAMFLVGGGIFSHNVPTIEHLFKGWAAMAGPLEVATSLLLDGLLGVLIGAILVPIVSLGARLTGQGGHSNPGH